MAKGSLDVLFWELGRSKALTEGVLESRRCRFFLVRCQSWMEVGRRDQTIRRDPGTKKGSEWQ